MSTTNTIKSDNPDFTAHDRIAAALFGVVLVAAAVGVLDLLGSF